MGLISKFENGEDETISPSVNKKIRPTAYRNLRVRKFYFNKLFVTHFKIHFYEAKQNSNLFSFNLLFTFAATSFLRCTLCLLFSAVRVNFKFRFSLVSCFLFVL